MKYFDQDFINFFKELSNNNSTEWFNDNRKTYEKKVKEPFNLLVGEMINRIQQYEPDVKIKPADAIMRINKDIRFSKDKAPYNTHVAANISIYGKKDKSYPGFYFQISADEIQIFGGAYMLENDQLQKVRSYIANNLPAFSKVYTDSEFIDKFGTIQGEKSKRIPPEFQDVKDVEPLVLNKQFYFKTALSAVYLLQDNLPEKLMEYYTAGKKLNDFLKGALNLH